MNKYYFSAETLGFYPESMKPRYEATGTWPGDTKLCTNEQYLTYSKNPPEGKTRGAGDNGLPRWIDVILTPDELAIIERAWRDGELQRADIEVFKAEDTAGAFNAEDWRLYRKNLRSWPDSVDFPDSTKRPAAPDAV